jgi:DnaJ-class molecular chaperone
MEIPDIEGYERPPETELGLRATPPCQFCGGLGWRYQIETVPGYTEKRKVRCSPCGGKGKVDKHEVQRQVRNLTEHLEIAATSVRELETTAAAANMPATAAALSAASTTADALVSAMRAAQSVMYERQGGNPP